jgi:ribulose-5-phosphate 4-epimerase/fuculose-1-phosphate aldolase
MADNEREGVIKYRLDYHTGHAPDEALIRPLAVWRGILRAVGLVGQDPARYDGLGFGNLSRRTGSPDPSGSVPPFVISGSQTGYLPHLGSEHFCMVRHCVPDRNALTADGLIMPSSEALTHGAIYAARPHIGFVFHAHDPAIWSHADALGIPVTPGDVAYGTPEMAAAVRRLFDETDAETRGLFAMGGHPDGVVAFGDTAREAGTRLIAALAEARELAAAS